MPAREPDPRTGRCSGVPAAPRSDEASRRESLAAAISRKSYTLICL